MPRLEDHLNNDNPREDLFELEDGDMGFPCCVCIHKNRPAAECEACRHYN